jgi:outer membrane protein
MKKIVIITGLALAALAVSITSLVMNLYNQQKKLVYVEMGKVYNEFALAKELTKEYESMMKVRNHVLDSLYKDLQFQTSELKANDKKTMADLERVAKVEQSYLYKQQQFEKENQTISEEMNAKIWSQLNQYLGDYGKKNNYAYVFGANGQGNIMYANEDENITQEAIAYVNARYNGQITN